MNKSESINEIAAAMSKFQGEITNAFKGKAGHGYNYAELSSILDIARPLLSKNGLALIQMPSNSDVGSVCVETLITHSSGQWLEQHYAMRVPENKRNSEAQNIGSAITYARRYAAAAALAIAQTDNDATSQTEASGKAVEATKADIQGALNKKEAVAVKQMISSLSQETLNAIYAQFSKAERTVISQIMGWS